MFVGKMKKSKVKNWEAAFSLALAKDRPAEPIGLGQPLRVIVALFYNPPASRKAKTCNWKVTKPDADNAVKVILDALVTQRYIEADQKIADLRVMKLEWDHGGFIEVMIGPCDPFLPDQDGETAHKS